MSNGQDISSDISAALIALNALISLIKSLRAQSGLDGDALGELADSKDLANAAEIKRLLAG